MKWFSRVIRMSWLAALIACGSSAGSAEPEAAPAPAAEAQATHEVRGPVTTIRFGSKGGLGLCMSLHMSASEVTKSCEKSEKFLASYKNMKQPDGCDRADALAKAAQKARDVASRCRAGEVIEKPAKAQAKGKRNGRMKPGHARADARHRALLAKVGGNSPYGEGFPAPNFEACQAHHTLLAMNLPIGSTAASALDHAQRKKPKGCSWAREYLACRALVDITEVKTMWLHDRLEEAKAEFLSCRTRGEL